MTGAVSPSSSLLSEFFARGVQLADVAALHRLLRARPALDAFVALFRGGNDEVLLRRLVQREIGARGDLDTASWRITQEIGNTQAVLDGDLDPFIEASLKQGV
jgi:hypothetical protein